MGISSIFVKEFSNDHLFCSPTARVSCSVNHILVAFILLSVFCCIVCRFTDVFYFLSLASFCRRLMKLAKGLSVRSMTWVLRLVT